MLEYTLNKKQFNELEALAYWIADSSYMTERFGNNEPELQRVRSTIHFIFDELDKLCVPFWVQNTVIFFADDWRFYKDNYLIDYLKTKNITVSA